MIDYIELSLEQIISLHDGQVVLDIKQAKHLKGGMILWVKEPWKPIGWDGNGLWKIRYADGSTQNVYTLYGDEMDYDGEMENDFFIQISDMLHERMCPVDMEGRFIDPELYLDFFPASKMPYNVYRLFVKVSVKNGLVSLRHTDAFHHINNRRNLDKIKTTSYILDGIDDEWVYEYGGQCDRWLNSLFIKGYSEEEVTKIVARVYGLNHKK